MIYNMKQYECIKDFLNYKVGEVFIDSKEYSRSRWFNRRHFKNKEYFKEVQKGRWKPKVGDTYYVAWVYRIDCYRYKWREPEIQLIKMWEAHQTEEQAEAYKYLVEHEQMMYDNWDKDNIYYQYNVGSVGWFRDEYRWELPSKWIVPYGRTHKQMTDHKKKLMLVYPRLFNK